ncbi:flagellar hook-basal body complex protein FliE [Priestia filamentosa]|uniref:flagellar hook-basal body complex protein FliE n=1 Tax=Priestia filamentosa TaxID=1402861 RepID=UPI0002D9A82F|nr:flagellar hook-basal body complex protein FliE [Priestia filamentosa]MDT3764082.1 flagellar hook-basal body complex protein FliE [Priestia filamentosa]OXS71444.1 flagellar hook-basal body complex protein FliE [Priestia filamentosa]RJS67087.1 flagellar hook-basal body complex protein FliE [Priestia filamentosa]WCM14717.1 flagellar hook-basal body complex protein FliE [Priestia filamentosa]WRU94479.1 flagellar hook-basal body complex protein FliE [Priestia filamentosa]
MINGITNISLQSEALQPKNESASTNQSFSNFLKDAVNKVNEAQNESDAMTTKLVNGEDVDLHNVMISSQKASVALQAAIQFRNKGIEAYQEIMRMQI